MESYATCKLCGEKNSANSFHCRKCGAELPLMRQEKKDIVQGSTSESTEINHKEEEREIITELEQLYDGPLTGRIIALLLQLEKLQSLSPGTREILGHFKTHKDDDVKNIAKKILVQRFAEKFPIISPDVKEKLIFREFKTTRYSLFNAKRYSLFNAKRRSSLLARLIFFSFWLLLLVFLMPNEINPFGLLILFIGVFYLFYNLRDYLEAKNSSNWPYVIGTIISSKLKTFEVGNGDSTERAEVSYTFNVNEIEYSSKRVKAGINLSTTNLSSAKKTAAKYHVGREVHVYYNPRSPKKSFLETGVNPMLKGHFFLSFLIMIIGLAILISF